MFGLLRLLQCRQPLNSDTLCAHYCVCLTSLFLFLGGYRQFCPNIDDGLILNWSYDESSAETTVFGNGQHHL